MTYVVVGCRAKHTYIKIVSTHGWATTTTSKTAIVEIMNSRKARCLPIAYGQLKPRIHPIESNRTSGADGYRQGYLKVQYSCIAEMSSKYDYILIDENGMRIWIVLLFSERRYELDNWIGLPEDKILNCIDFAWLTVIEVPFTM
jgi:hypothetical protein